MGWYESPETPGVMLGDEAFDAMHACLERVSEVYRAGLQRRPTLDELRTLLEIELEVVGGEVLEDLGERVVTQVAIKTAKKPRDQRFGAGDVFAIPLEGRFAFGRVMLLSKADGMLIEVFRQTSESKALGRSAATSGRLLQPLRLAGGASLKSWRWTVVSSDPSYRRSPDERIEFVSPHPAGGALVAVDLEGNILRTVSAADASTMISGKLWSPASVEQRITEELGGERRR